MPSCSAPALTVSHSLLQKKSLDRAISASSLADTLPCSCFWPIGFPLRAAQFNQDKSINQTVWCTRLSRFCFAHVCLCPLSSPPPPTPLFFCPLQQARAEQEEEFISNTLFKKIQALQKEKETLAVNYEKEEEFLTNELSRKLMQVSEIVAISFVTLLTSLIVATLMQIQGFLSAQLSSSIAKYLHCATTVSVLTRTTFFLFFFVVVHSGLSFIVSQISCCLKPNTVQKWLECSRPTNPEDLNELPSSRLPFICTVSFFPHFICRVLVTCTLSHCRWLAAGWLMVCWCVRSWGNCMEQMQLALQALLKVLQMDSFGLFLILPS